MAPRRCLLVTFAAVAALTGCGSPWVVLRQVVPNPMGAGAPFYVQPVTLAGLRVGDLSEAEWMGPKSPETKDSWDADKVAMNVEFARGFTEAGPGILRASGPAAAFSIVTRFVHYEPGFYAVVVSRPGRIDAIVDILDPNGTPLDEFETIASCSGFSQGGNARACSRSIGANVARYVLERTGAR